MKLILNSLVFCVLIFSSISCIDNKQGVMAPDILHKVIEKDSTIQLIDVRTPEEFNEGHIKYALNIDFFDEDFSEKINKLNKQKPVYVYCRSGNRSGKSVEELKNLGFKSVYDLEGGILKWLSEGFKVVQINF